MKQVMILGAAIVDVLVSPADESVFQTGSYAAERILMTHGGDGLNEATVLAKLGGEVRLTALVGEDEPGRSVLRRMEYVGLDAGGIKVCPNIHTSVNVVLVKPGGERCFLTDPAATQRCLTIDDIPMPFPKEVEILSFASIFVFPRIKTGELELIFRQAKEQGIVVCADMTKRKSGETLDDLAPALKYVDYLFPNDAEAMLLTGAPTAEDAARALYGVGVGTVIVKCGERGCFVKTRDREFWSDAEQGVRCVDTTGAGDSFVGGFLYALSQELSLEDCLKQAHFCGGRAVEQMGAVTWIAP